MDKLLSSIHKWKNWGFDHETVARFQKDIDCRNAKALYSFGLVYSVLNIFFFLLEFIFGNSQVALGYIIVSFSVLLFFTLYFKRISTTQSPTKFTSICVTSLTMLTYGFTIFWSTYMQPNDYGVFAVCMLFFMPFMVNEKPVKSIFQALAVVLVFSYISFQIKNSVYAVSDTIHASIAAVAGTMVSYTKNCQMLEELITTEKFEKANAELEFLNTIDILTGLFNRKKIFAILDEITSKSKEENKTVACAILDLDNFKMINDTYGHPQGDIVLRHAGNAIREIVQPAPKVYAGRIGGEEFMMLGYDMTADEFGKVCTKLNKAVNSSEVFSTQENEMIFTSVSCGFCVLDKDRLSHLYNYADKALYYAKNNGKNCSWQYSVETGEYCLYKG